ncbi:radical SAM protein [Hydrogenobacter thermophilus]|uniref:radical SAM protein n=1 Tax=Hydrogenobacter thermophilus TaxID=940 RepID=UPI0030F5E255
MGEEQKLRILSRLTAFERDGDINLESCIYMASTPRGKVPVLKVMQTTMCDKNCTYCAFRRDRDITPRLYIPPEELAKSFMKLYNSNKVKGLFLSSGIFGHSEFIMEKMIDTVKILRSKYDFKGYVHLKLMPGISLQTLEEAVKVADRVSINIETSKEERIKRIAKGKSILQDILPKMEAVNKLLQNYRDKSQITQMMVGVDGEKDEEIIRAVHFLNRHYRLSRIYFSAFFPVKGTPLENRPPESPLREYRLYQVDFLIRDYHFELEDLKRVLVDSNLPLDRDPKEAWAQANPELFPVELNTADYRILIRVPGIGRETAKEIIKRRREKKLGYPQDLKGIRNLKKVLQYTTLNGRYYGTKSLF